MADRMEGAGSNVPRGRDAAVLERLTAAQLDELDVLAADCLRSLPGLSVADQLAALREVVAEIDDRISVMLEDLDG